MSTAAAGNVTDADALVARSPLSDVLICIPLGDTSDEEGSNRLSSIEPYPDFDIDTAAAKNSSHIITEGVATTIQLDPESPAGQIHTFGNMPRHARRRLVAIEKQRVSQYRQRGLGLDEPEPHGLKQELEAWALAYDRKMANGGKMAQRQRKRSAGPSPRPKTKSTKNKPELKAWKKGKKGRQRL
ncbi:hypothetical protein BROUX41_000806 [Berkeleyomyces rouxiae]|uniref:uncharacterized protein n=1 Tax=Berkeleyomyces rouxiae TaxID=2035830 RepID=UPI003B79B64B